MAIPTAAVQVEPDLWFVLRDVLRGDEMKNLPKLVIMIHVTHKIRVFRGKKVCRNFAENDGTMSKSE